VIFAMIASYILSRTLVPTLATYWMKGHGTASPPTNLKAEDHGKPKNTFPLFFVPVVFMLVNKMKASHWDRHASSAAHPTR